MQAPDRTRARDVYNLAAQKKLDHNGRSNTITVGADEWATLLAWYKIMLDADDARAERRGE